MAAWRIQAKQLTKHLRQLMLHPWLEYSPKHREKQRKVSHHTKQHGDIVMVIDGETFCVPEEDEPKVYYEENDGQMLPTENSN